MSLANIEATTLDVHLECPSFVEGFRFPEQARAHLGFERPPVSFDELAAAGPRLDYTVDLPALVQSARTLGIAHQAGQSYVLPLRAFLGAPIPDQSQLDVHVDFLTPTPRLVATGLERRDPEGHRYRLRAREVPVATYVAFGNLQHGVFDVPGRGQRPATIEVTLLDEPLALSQAQLLDWSRESAQLVADFYGGFPVDRATLILAPVAGLSRVHHATLLPESAPGIAVLFGARATARDLDRDWILVHEFLHLGVPFLGDEGAWLDEGLATYFEPLLRARSGRTTPEAVFDDFERWFPRVREALEVTGLESADSARAAYWGGAYLCLLADLEARRTTGKTLEGAVRALRNEGGHASRVWSLERAIRVIDEALGAPILADLRERHARRGSPTDFEALWTKLGVGRVSGKIVFDTTAEWAGFREALVDPASNVVATINEPPSRDDANVGPRGH